MIESLFIHIIIIIIASLIISYFTTRFFQLPVDIFNASNGLLFAFLFAFSTLQEFSTLTLEMDHLIIIILMMAQICIGILVILSYLAFKRFKEENPDNPWKGMLKISLTYCFSLLLGLTSYYLVSILYVNQNSIFTVGSDVKGGFSVIFSNIMSYNMLGPLEFIIIIVVLFVVSFFFNCIPQLKLAIDDFKSKKGDPNE